ncbi:MAG TPA: sialate O-acetylesterase [Chthoniobacteraceae bacterium]|jgi:sialate O-acetylesterase
MNHLQRSSVSPTSLALLAITFSSAAFAAVKPASPFTDHLVLQRDLPVPVWGTADAGEEVTVSFAEQTHKVRAGADGKWRVELAPLKASAEGRALTFTGSATPSPIALKDVLVGEVWLCSGQSNMDFTVAKTPKYYFAGVNNEAEEVAAANFPEIRMFTGNTALRYEPQTEVQGTWKICNPENVREFSAVGYFFARDLHRELKVPVGIVTLTFGASTAQAWIRREAIAAHPQLAPLLAKFDEEVTAFRTDPEVAAKHAEAVKRFREANAQPRQPGQRAPRGPKNPDPVADQHNPTVMFNGMIAPFVPFALRGVLWYQGESITGPRELFPIFNEVLITDWRKLWGRELPFFFCQLAAHKAPATEPGPSSIAAVRELQAQALKLPNTAMAVTIDIGDEKDVHPHNKQDVGARLARIALARTYERKVPHSGPVFASMKVEGSKARLKFTEAEGLTAKDGPLKHFAIAGADGKFVWADAVIEGDSVVASSPQVAEPAAVRYAWSDNPAGCNLYNAAGLPAAPFRTDQEKTP